MNVSMMVLTDCISIEGAFDKDLVDYIEKFGHICELKAVAYKDLHDQSTENNLYNFWHMWKKGELDEKHDRIAMKIQFFQFIEEHCKYLIEKQYNIK